MSRVLVISPHPDDEAIGCGGTIRKHVTAGDTVHVLFLTSGERGGHGRGPQETARLREQEAAAAGQVLGVVQMRFWREPDGAFQATRRNVAQLLSVLQEWEPTHLYVPHLGEMHPDHRGAARMVRSAVAQWVGSRPTVLTYEVWTPLPRMSHIVDISPHVEIKLTAIRAHRSQCEAMRLDEAALALNRYRGEMHSWPGGPYAEVFQEMRF